MAAAPPCCCSSSLHLNPWLRWRWRGTRPPRRLTPLAVVSSTPPPASTAHTYNGWGELAAAPEVSLLTDNHGLLLLIPTASALALLSLSRLPPLPLLAAAFTAGFAARHLSSSSSFPQGLATPSRLTLVLADLDAQVRALKDHHLAAAASSSPELIDAVDRLRDAVLEATRLAGQPDDTRAPDAAVLAPLVDLAHSLAAWARHTLRGDLSSPRNKTPKDNNTHNPAAAAPAQRPKPFVDDDSATTAGRASERATLLDGVLPFHDHDDAQGLEEEDDAGLERLLLNHRRHGRDASQRNDHFQGASSLLEERTLEIRDRSCRLNIQHRHSERPTSVAQHGGAGDDDPSLGTADASDDPMCHETAAADPDGEEFSRNVKEAAEILKKAREYMMASADQETADALLYKSARLLSTAVALRPTSLVAVGQLGNTYLLHGELKLKISRELRTLLASSGALLNGRERAPRSRKVLDTRLLSRDNISSALVDVCEECESLLVEAGRSYRTALSIDSGDVKALYNWGLALIFRAQLLADIGPEAALDADQVYLAAIDKFDAMLSKSNTYAPEALYRWGTALQQRSYLRPRNNREKIRLLEQAKNLFEDVLYVEADNKMVREALSSCISELNYHGRWL